MMDELKNMKEVVYKYWCGHYGNMAGLKLG